MPDEGARRDLVCHLLAQHGDHKVLLCLCLCLCLCLSCTLYSIPLQLSGKDLDKIVSLTSGYSCSDLTNLARDAALAPVMRTCEVLYVHCLVMYAVMFAILCNVQRLLYSVIYNICYTL